MKIIITLIFLTALILNPFSSASAEGVRGELQGAHFGPWNAAFRDLYGGGFSYSAEATIGLWKNVDIWVGAGYYSKKGKLSLTGEETAIKIRTVGWGLKYNLPKGRLNFYAGAGFNYFLFDETNPIGDSTAGKIGPDFRAGVWLRISKRLSVDFFLRATTCVIFPAAYEVDIGGFSQGLGLAYRF